MRLKEEVYRVLESIVGEENISRDEAILDGYAWQFGSELYGPEDGAYAHRAFTPSEYLEETGDEAKLASPRGSRFGFRPVAVVLPADTSEVQAVVKACNRYGIKFKAHSTGWGPWSGCGTDGMVQIDLRRMNRILEINEEDMYAVIEPYVVWSTLQAETMKRGLNCVTIGAGGNASPPSTVSGITITPWASTRGMCWGWSGSCPTARSCASAPLARGPAGFPAMARGRPCAG